MARWSVHACRSNCWTRPCATLSFDKLQTSLLLEQNPGSRSPGVIEGRIWDLVSPALGRNGVERPYCCMQALQTCSFRSTSVQRGRGCSRAAALPCRHVAHLPRGLSSVAELHCMRGLRRLDFAGLVWDHQLLLLLLPIVISFHRGHSPHNGTGLVINLFWDCPQRPLATPLSPLQIGTAENSVDRDPRSGTSRHKRLPHVLPLSLSRTMCLEGFVCLPTAHC